MIRFSLFGVPVEIQPWFWVTTALLGGAYRVSTTADLLHVLLFMVVALISILVHEFGHALVGRKLGGGTSSIVLWSLGGLAYSHGGRFTRSGNFWRVAAGPGAGFVLFLITVLGLCLAYTPQGGIAVTSLLLFHEFWVLPTPEVLALLTGGSPKLDVIYQLLWINFWWSLVNLLPVLPLDGGRIADLFVKPQRRVYQIGMITAALMAVVGGSLLKDWWILIMFGFLAYRNYQEMKENSWR